jgi:hypothetical protein
MAIRIVNMIHEAVWQSVEEVCPIKTVIKRTAMVIIDVDDETAERVRNLDGVISVTNDMQGEPFLVRETPEQWNWGPARISNTLSRQKYTYNKTGRGVDIYIFDHGINYYHPEFAGNDDYDNPELEDITSLGLTFPYGDSHNGWRLPQYGRVAPLRVYLSTERWWWEEGMGYLEQYMPVIGTHGTQVASQAGGNTCGIATGARLISVCSDLTLADFLICVDLIIGHHEIKLAANVSRPSVVNMSFGYSPSVSGFTDPDGDANRAIVKAHLDEMANAGILLVASAGNNGYLLPRDTVRFAPAGHHSVITVGAMDEQERLSSWSQMTGSNYGSGVDIFSPGSDVRGANFTWDTSVYTNPVENKMQAELFYSSQSGTSMAGPFAAGALACVLELQGNPVFTGTASQKYDHSQEFQRFFLDNFYDSWTPVQHQTRISPYSWADGWPADDDGSAEKILFLNGSEVKMATPITNLADLCRASTVGDYILTADIDATITAAASAAAAWEADTAYAVDEFVTNGTTTYRCIAPVSDSGEGDFATQLAANKWILAWTTATGWAGHTWATAGSLNGNGFKITNLTVAKTSGKAGLFLAATNSTFENIILENASVSTTTALNGGAGAICDAATNCTFTNCHVSGAVVSRTGRCGGLVGYMVEGSLTECSSSCTVTDGVGGNCHCGGIVGHVATTGITVSRCYSTGAVTKLGTGNFGAGGIIGYSTAVCTVLNCYSTGAIQSAANQSGGIIGYYQQTVGTINNCYATGDIDSASSEGGIIGTDLSAEAGVVVTNCFWDTETTGLGDGAGLYSGDDDNGRTTAEMKTKSTFTGWNFNTVWMIPQEGLVSDYPKLMWPYDIKAGSPSGILGGRGIF